MINIIQLLQIGRGTQCLGFSLGFRISGRSLKSRDEDAGFRGLVLVEVLNEADWKRT